jgi:hypothetical protein
MAVAALRNDPWLERVGPSTVLDIEVREPATKHAISLQQVERWLDGATTSPNEASRKARLKMMLVTGRYSFARVVGAVDPAIVRPRQ